MDVRIERVTRANVGSACKLSVAPEQQRFVAPVANSLAEAYVNPDTAWPRLVYDGDQLVAFVMGGFEPDAEIDFFRCGIWRLNVAAEHQGKGYGRFAVQAVFDEALRRGEKRVTVLWVPGEGGPAGFYEKLGFTPTGQEIDGQVVGEKHLA